MSINQKTAWPFLLIVALIILYTILFLPILHAGFLGDDVLNSLVRGTLQQEKLGLFHFCFNVALNWIQNSGRLFPLGFFLQYPFFYLFDQPVAYQATRLVFIAASLMSCAWLIQLLFKNVRISLAFLLFIPALWSIRGISDPLTSYSILFPSLTILIMVSLVGFLKYLEGTQAKCWLSLSLILYTFALMTYELGIITILCIFIFAHFYIPTKKRFFQKTMPHAIITLVYLISYWAVHHYAAGHYNGASIGSFSLKTLLTFLYQFTAALPLNYAIFAGHTFKPIVFEIFFSTPYAFAQLILLFLIAFMTFCRLFPHLTLDKRQRTLAFYLGLTLMIIPSLMIAITIKYQHVLAWGLGYLPVYIQYFGVASVGLGLLSCLNLSVSETLKIYWKFILAFLFALIICLSFIFNTVVVKHENLKWQNGRTLEVQAISQGLFKSLPPDAIIISKDQWATPAFYLQHGAIKNYSFILIDSNQLLPTTQSPQILQPRYPFMTNSVPYHIDGQTHKTSTTLTVSNPHLIIQNHAHPLFLMKYTQKPYAKDGTVILGQVSHLEFNRLDKNLVLKKIVLKQPHIFIQSKQHQSLHATVTNQNIKVTWHCFYKFMTSPPSFNQIGHVNICKVP